MKGLRGFLVILSRRHFKTELGEGRPLSFFSFPQCLAGSGVSKSEYIFELISIPWQFECYCWCAQTNLIFLQCKLNAIPLLKTFPGFLRIKSKLLSLTLQGLVVPGPLIFHLTPKYIVYLHCEFGFTSHGFLGKNGIYLICATLAFKTKRQDSLPWPQLSAGKGCIKPKSDHIILQPKIL